MVTLKVLEYCSIHRSNPLWGVYKIIHFIMNHPVSVNTFHKFACFQSFILLITKLNYFIIILPTVIYHYTAISLAFRATSREPIMIV